MRANEKRGAVNEEKIARGREETVERRANEGTERANEEEGVNGGEKEIETWRGGG